MTIRKFAALGACAVAGTIALNGLAFAQSGPVIGVSWSNFQEERWKTDEAAIKAAIDAAGGSYVSADAQSSSAKQLADVESLIARGVVEIRAGADAPREIVLTEKRSREHEGE